VAESGCVRHAQGQTKVTFRLSYQAPGEILGYIADRIAVRQVGRTLAGTLQCLKELGESQGTGH
jgi:uncharacterized membrane protein